MSLKTRIICLVCLSLILPTASAQRPQQQNRSMEGQPKLNVDYSGGPLVELINEIAKQNEGFTPNVMLNDGSREIEIPPIHFANVHMQELMTALSYTSLPLEIKQISNEVWSVTSISTTRSVAVHSIRELLDSNNPVHYKVDYIATAIQTAWAMIPSVIKPNMKVHLETGLLIIEGDRARQETAGDVINQLYTQQESSRVRNLERNLQLTKTQCEDLRKQIDELIRENKLLKQQLDLNTVQKTD